MKKAIMVLGYIFSVLIVLVIAGIVSLSLIGSRLDKESKAYVDTAIPAIVSEWDIGEIEKRASREFNDVVDYDDLEKYFSMLKQLGNLVEYKGAIGDSNITLSFQYGYEITADYTASADFETGSVDVQISLIKHNGQWQILDLSIDPQEFNGRSDII